MRDEIPLQQHAHDLSHSRLEPERCAQAAGQASIDANQLFQLLDTGATYSGDAPWKNDIHPVTPATIAERARPATSASTAVCGEKAIYVKAMPAAYAPIPKNAAGPKVRMPA